MFDTYTPQSTTNNVTTGPYEIHGPWSLVLTGNSHANFYAALNMELSDGWVLTQNSGNFDPAARGAHTHHITLLNGTVTTLSTGGIEITGSAKITVNGAAAPVSPSDVVIDITGGTTLHFPISHSLLPCRGLSILETNPFRASFEGVRTKNGSRFRMGGAGSARSVA